jgi:glycosyltransferase involved in cell wall biosynthesis
VNRMETAAGVRDQAAPAEATVAPVRRTVALVPAFNEAQTIARVITGLRGVVDHVLVVDDGSMDGTGAIAQREGAEVVTYPGNRGKGHAIRTGIAALASRDFTHVLLLDGDMQHLPSEAPLLLDAAAQTGVDLVLGERRFGRESMPAARYHANRLGSRALSWFVGVPLRDTQCGFRVVRLSALRDVPLRARGYDIETEMLVKLWRRGATMTSVPITAVYAGQASKLRPVRDTTKTCFLAVYYRYIERL